MGLDFFSRPRVSVVAIEANIAVEAVRPVPAVLALPGLSLAGAGVSVAFAWLAVGEIPVAGLALVASAAVCILGTAALPVSFAAKGIQRAKIVTVAD